MDALAYLYLAVLAAALVPCFKLALSQVCFEICLWHVARCDAAFRDGNHVTHAHHAYRYRVWARRHGALA